MGERERSTRGRWRQREEGGRNFRDIQLEERMEKRREGKEREEGGRGRENERKIIREGER